MSRLLDRLWYGTPPAWLRILEIPLALAAGCYALGLRFDQQRKISRQKKLPRPVISIGNITVGGTGKTPLTIQLAQWLVEWGYHPCVLSRGYGSDSKVVRRVENGSRNWRLYGDEPLLIAHAVPEALVYLGADRFEAGILALQEHPEIDVFLLDDGFQHRQLVRDLDIVLVDGDRGMGNSHLLPHGPLREPSSALNRADLVGRIFRGGAETGIKTVIPTGDFRATLQPFGFRPIRENIHNSTDGDHPSHVQMTEPCQAGIGSGPPLDGPVHLFSAIGSPRGFHDTAASLGINIVGETIFPDHHPFSEQDIFRVLEECRKKKAIPLTTAKDEVRLLEYKKYWTQGPVPIIMEVGLKFEDDVFNLIHTLKEILLGGRRDP